MEHVQTLLWSCVYVAFHVLIPYRPSQHTLSTSEVNTVDLLKSSKMRRWRSSATPPLVPRLLSPSNWGTWMCAREKGSENEGTRWGWGCLVSLQRQAGLPWTTGSVRSLWCVCVCVCACACVCLVPLPWVSKVLPPPPSHSSTAPHHYY